jgi:hypothetical protein
MPNSISNIHTPKPGSSQNALKRGFHAVVLQPGEDEQEVLALHQQICAEYRVTFELDSIMVSHLVQCMLTLNRIDRYKQKIVDGALYGHEYKEEFRLAAGLSELEYPTVPDGLLRYDPKVVERGLELVHAIEELARLMCTVIGTDGAGSLASFPAHSPVLKLEPIKLSRSVLGANGAGVLASLSDHSPALLKELQLLGLVKGEGAAKFFERRYGKAPVGTHLYQLSIELGTDNKVALSWHMNEKKYRAIIDSLQAKASLSLIRDPNITRYETTCFNRVLKLREELQRKMDRKVFGIRAVNVPDQLTTEVDAQSRVLS